MRKANIDIRTAVKQYGFYLWQIADRLGISDNTLNRRLRKELPQEEKEAIINMLLIMNKEVEPNATNEDN